MGSENIQGDKKYFEDQHHQTGKAYAIEEVLGQANMNSTNL